MTETAIVQAIRRRLGCRHDVWLVRFNGGAFTDETGSFVRTASVNGTPDLVGILTVNGVGVYLGIEVKSATGRQSKDQRTYQGVVERHGGVYILARSADEAATLVNQAADRLRSLVQGYRPA